MDNNIREKSRWQFDRTISIPTVTSLITCIALAMWFFAGQDTRISLVEREAAISRINQATTDARQDAERNEMRRQMREDYQNINSKLDRIIEKRP